MEKVLLKEEEVYLKKSKYFGWRVVYPVMINGKFNLKHFLVGRSWTNLIFMGIIVVVLLGGLWEWSNTLKIANECLGRYTIIFP